MSDFSRWVFLMMRIFMIYLDFGLPVVSGSKIVDRRNIDIFDEKSSSGYLGGDKSPIIFQTDGTAPPPGSPVDRNNQLRGGNWFQTQLVLSLVIGSFSFITFCYSRSRSSLTFAPRSHLPSHKPSAPHPVEQSTGFFTWIIPTLKTPERSVLQIAGLDAVILLYFFKLGFYYFLTCTIFAFAILVPINIHENGTTEGVPPDPPPVKPQSSFPSVTIQGFLSSDNEPAWSTLMGKITIYHTCHLLFTYFFTLILLKFLKITYNNYIAIKPIFSLAHRSSAPLRTVMIENLPLHLRNDSALFDYFNDVLKLRVENATVVKDVSNLVKLLERRTKALMNLENAWTQWLGNPVRPTSVKGYSPANEVERIISPGRLQAGGEVLVFPQSSHALQQHRTTSPGTDQAFTEPTLQSRDSASEYIQSASQVTTDRERPTYRPSWFSLKRVDLIDHLTAEFQTADDLVRRRRKGKFRCMSSGFVTFKSFVDAQTICQVIHWPKPEQAAVSPAPEPRDIYWSNLNLSSISLKTRNAAVLICMTLLYGFWATPVTFLAKLMSYESLTSLLGPEFVKLVGKSPTLKALIQNSLPTLAIIIFNALLPFFLEWLCTIQGFKSKSLIEYSLLKKYHLFLLITVLLIFVAVSTVSLLRDIRENPGRLVDKIATSLPGARYFFTSYLMLQSLAIIPLQLLQLPSQFSRIFYRLTTLVHTPRFQSQMKNMRLEVLSLGNIYPQALLAFTICITYSVIAPIILIFGVIYFGMAYLVYKYKILNVYCRRIESQGRAWPIACNRIGWGMIIFQVFMLGLLSLREAFMLSTLVIPLILYTVYQLVHLNSVYNRHSKFIALSQLKEGEETEPSEEAGEGRDERRGLEEDGKRDPKSVDSNKTLNASTNPSRNDSTAKPCSQLDEVPYISGKDDLTDNFEPPISTVFTGVLDTGQNRYFHPAIFGSMPLPQLPVVRSERDSENRENVLPLYREDVNDQANDGGSSRGGEGVGSRRRGSSDENTGGESSNEGDESLVGSRDVKGKFRGGPPLISVSEEE